MLELFTNREELIKKYDWREFCMNCGPVHKHGEELYVQIYLGQHEWMAINVSDTNKVFLDDGWRGDEFGYGFVDDDLIRKSARAAKDFIDPPFRKEGKPITTDDLLFAPAEKIVDYLGENDPIAKQFIVKKV